ncbi:methionyl-tRNA formyltransferase [uncultured Sphingomonas sp.]|uniref:methionyl-tRNA formyltransferase n=1 Tax=uncultured Sphingomonas sp. TaxID=158754 RepID=UPI0035CAE9E1
MRIVFMGTPDFAVPVLDAVVAAGHDIVACYTQPPRPGGRRGRTIVPSPIQARAEALGIAVRSPVSLRTSEAQAEFAALRADIGVVAAYGLILPRTVLDACPLGCLNVHASLLPRWRGAAPIQRAILAGDAETGVCIMQMEAGLDTGPVRLEERTPIARKDAGELTAELSAMGARLMVDVLGDFDRFPAVVQPDEGVTYASKIDKPEARIDWGRSAAEVERQVRAFAPTPGAWFEVAGERVKVLEATVHHPGEGRDRVASGGAFPASDPGVELRPPPACLDDRNAPFGMALDDLLTIACEDGAIRPTLVQRAGRGVTSAADLLRGFPIPPGMRV